jgi:glycosyltransferase 2 family protein
LLGGVVVLAGGLAARAGEVTVVGANLFRLLYQLPDAVGRPLVAAVQLGSLAVVPVAVGLALTFRRSRLAGALAVAGGVAWALARVVQDLVGRAGAAELLGSVVERMAQAGAGYPSRHVAVAAALATTAGPYLPRVARRASWWAVALVALGGVHAGLQLPLDALGGAALGWAVAGAVHLALGTPGGLSSPSEVLEGLRAAGIQAVKARPVNADARGSAPYLVSTAGGEELFVKAVGREQRDADLLYKLWRYAAFREVEDEAPFASPKQQVEHEAYLALLAERAGVRTPAVVLAAATPGGGAVLAQRHVMGRTLDGPADKQVQDSLLAAIWAEVNLLRKARIAHRDLRLANVMVDQDGAPWLIDFGFAEAAASPHRLAQDVAELLASLAVLVGAERAVASATAALGSEAVATAAPLLQPLALSTATRVSLRRRQGLLAELQARAALGAVQVPRLEPLVRVQPAMLLLLLGGLFAVHLLLPQVGELRQTLDALGRARWPWLAAGLVAAAVSYLAAGLALVGSAGPELAFGRTTAVQLATSFANPLAPAGLGGAGLNALYLERAGLTRADAAAAVAVNLGAGALVHAGGLLLAIAVTGRTSVGDVRLPSGWPALIAVVAALALAGVVVWVPALRRRVLPRALRRRVLWPAWQGVLGLRATLRRPGKAARLLGGSSGVTACYILALYASLEAFGADLPLAKVAVAYLGGAALASISPTPGGLGALEAALVAGLTAVGGPAGPVIAGVLTFRLLTFWLPVLPGWLVFRALRARGTV